MESVDTMDLKFISFLSVGSSPTRDTKLPFTGITVIDKNKLSN